MKNILPLLLLCIFISGCATTRSPSKTAQLEVQVNQLQKQLEDRDTEIEELKSTVNNLTAQLDSDENYAFNDVEDLDATSQRSIKKALATPTIGSDTDIIRVAVAAIDIQRALKSAGYYNGAIDGKIGSGSKQAIRDFQKDHQLKVDGIIGKRTWEELKNYLN